MDTAREREIPGTSRGHPDGSRRHPDGQSRQRGAEITAACPAGSRCGRHERETVGRVRTRVPRTRRPATYGGPSVSCVMAVVEPARGCPSAQGWGPVL